MTEEELKKDREIINAATPGPWTAYFSFGSSDLPCSIERNLGKESIDEVEIPIRETIFELTDHCVNPAENIRFTSEARTRWPAALDEIERLRTALEKIANIRSQWQLREKLTAATEIAEEALK